MRRGRPFAFLPSQFLGLTFAVGVAASHASNALAVDYFWNPTNTNPQSYGSGTWDTTSLNWNPTAPVAGGTGYGTQTTWVDGTGNVARFPSNITGTAPTSVTVTLGGDRTANKLDQGSSYATDVLIVNAPGNTFSLTLGGTTPSIAPNASSKKMQVDVELKGTAGLTKLNGGAAVLTFANNYTGVTNVTTGTLYVNGSHGLTTLADNYTVTGITNANATLSGNGTIALASAKTITASATVAGNTTGRGIIDPGATANSIATLTVGGSGNGVVFGDYGRYSANVGASNASDRLHITSGDLNLNSVLDSLAVTGTNTGTFQLADWTGTRTGVFETFIYNGTTQTGSFDITNSVYTAGNLTLTYNDTAKQLTLTVAAPEPASILTVALAGCVLALRRRR